MKKVSIVLAVLLVAALIFGGVELSQKGALQNTLNSTQEEVKSVKSQLDAKVKELADSTAALDSAKSELESAKAELQSKVTELTDGNSALETLKGELESKVAELTDGTSALEALKGELESKVAELTDGNSVLETVKTELEAKVAELTDGNTALEAVKAELEAKVAELTDGNTALETIKSELEAKVNDLDSTVKSLTDKVSAAAEQVKLFASNFKGKTVILHSNDVHGQIDGYAYMPAVKKALEAAGADVIMVDAGDFSQGDIYVSVSKGATAVEMMNAAGYDVVTLGNHEFDYGYAQLMQNLEKASFQTICSDVLLLENGESILPGHVIIEKEGVKIGFFGLETPETATKVNPGLIKEIDFASFDNLYTNAQAEVDALKEEGADLVIGVWHLGVDEESAANGYRSIDVLGKMNGVDFVIDGHSHTVMTEGPAGEPIQSTGTKFAYIGLIVIDNESKKIEKNMLISTNGLPKDEETAAAAQKIMDDIDKIYNTPFATSAVDFNGDRAPGNRTQETNLGDLITDSMVWCVVNAASVTEDEMKNTVGITNGGGIRAPIAAGDITMKNVNTVLPFGNTVAVIRVTGAELLEALEASTYCTPDAIGGFPQTSGIVWTLDTSKAYDQGELYVLNGKDTSYYAPKSIQRVTIESVNGNAFDPEAIYVVVTNNFCAEGGDTYNVFNRAFSEGNGFDTNIPMDEALVTYIQDQLNSDIKEEPKGGRLTIK